MDDQTRSERSGQIPREGNARARTIPDAALDAILTENGEVRTRAISETAVDDGFTIHEYATVERREHLSSASHRNTIVL